jgi:hypothetical protein
LCEPGKHGQGSAEKPPHVTIWDRTKNLTLREPAEMAQTFLVLGWGMTYPSVTGMSHARHDEPQENSRPSGRKGKKMTVLEGIA